jgi:hypothetical protein
MRKLYYLVSAAAIATMVAAFAVPASAQPFSGMMGSWGSRHSSTIQVARSFLGMHEE